MHDDSFGERGEATFTQGYTGLNDSFATKQKLKLLININQSEKHERKGEVRGLFQISRRKARVKSSIALKDAGTSPEFSTVTRIQEQAGKCNQFFNKMPSYSGCERGRSDEKLMQGS
jgi:hypothetical protein